MIEDGSLKRQQPSKAYQGSRLFQANENMEAASETTRPNAIATLAYDAMRAMVDAHANADGLEPDGDRHRNSVAYARSAMGALWSSEDLDVYEALWYVRNRVLEYPPVGSQSSVPAADARVYLDAGQRMRSAMATWWADRARS